MKMNMAQRLFPWLIALLGLAIFAGAVVERKIDSPYDWEAFGEIPVSASGRTKPLDTYARNTLMILSGRQSLTVDGKPLSAIQWYADVMANPEQAKEMEVFRIDHPDLLAMLGFSSPGNENTRKRFAYNEILPSFDVLSEQGQLAFDLDPKARTSFQRQVIDLYGKISRYHETDNAMTPYLLPPLHEGEDWRPLFDALRDPALLETELVVSWRDMIGQYAHSDPAGFNNSVAAYRDLIAPALPGEMTKAKYEVIFNEVRPFHQAMAIYILAFLIAGFSFMLMNTARKEWAVSFWRAMMALLIIAFVIQTVGLTFRIVLQGRPPVTNLYSSAVFIGWGCVALGIFLEWIFKTGLPGMTSAVIGFATLIVAHHLGSSGDTMEMMQAVLDSNFWLATHVIVITIGYSATFLAGFLGIAFILLGVFSRALKSDGGKALSKMIYGVTCFGVITNFAGTVLGGIWADQSWGRFWGWDPKENGAVLIVLWTLLMLHARWGGMIRQRGMAVLAVGGNIVTAWSWFGTNMLGVGLHSYGFIDSAVFWLLLFVVSQLIVMAIGLTPWSQWRSFAKPGKPKPTNNEPRPEQPRAPEPALE